MKVALNDISGFCAVFGNTTHFSLKIFNAVECAFTLATGIRGGRETRFPPHVRVFKKKMVNDTIDKRGGENFASDRVVNNEGDAAARVIGTSDNSVAQAHEIFEIVYFETMFVFGFTLAADASPPISFEKFVQEKIFKFHSF